MGGAADCFEATASAFLVAGIRIFIPHMLQRTTFPRAPSGTTRIRWQDRLGHMMRMRLLSVTGCFPLGEVRTASNPVGWVSARMPRRLIPTTKPVTFLRLWVTIA